jgi:hypothetical protein
MSAKLKSESGTAVFIGGQGRRGAALSWHGAKIIT